MPSTLKDVPGFTPHGGALELRIAGQDEIADLREKAKSLPTIEATVAPGAVRPRAAGRRRRVPEPWLHDQGRLRLGRQRDASRERTSVEPPDHALGDRRRGRRTSKTGEPAAIVHEGESVAIIDVEDIYTYDAKRRGRADLQDDRRRTHPGVAYLYSQAPNYVGGDVTVLENVFAHEFSEYRLTPLQLREEIAKRGWKTVVAFQTRNPIHRAHEYLTKVALEIVDGLVIHPLVGGTKGDDIPAETRMKCYEVLMENYYPHDRVILSVFPPRCVTAARARPSGTRCFARTTA